MSSPQPDSESQHSKSRLILGFSPNLEHGPVDQPSAYCAPTSSAADAPSSTTALVPAPAPAAAAAAATVPKPLPVKLYRSVEKAAEAGVAQTSVIPLMTEPIPSALRGGCDLVAVRLRHLLAGCSESGPCASLGYCIPLGLFLCCSSEADPLDHVAVRLLANTYSLVSEMLKSHPSVQLEEGVLAALLHISIRLNDHLSRRPPREHGPPPHPSPATAPARAQRQAPVDKRSSADLDLDEIVPSIGNNIVSSQLGPQYDWDDVETAEFRGPRPADVGSPLQQIDIAEDLSNTQMLHASSMRQQEATWLSDLFRAGTDSTRDPYSPAPITVWRHVSGRSRTHNLRLLGAQLPKRFEETLARLDVWGKDQYFTLHAPGRETAKVKGEIAFQAIKFLNVRFPSGKIAPKANEVPLNLLNADFTDAPLSPAYHPPRFLQANCWLSRFAARAKGIGITLSRMSHILTVTTAGYFTHMHSDPTAGTVFSHILTGEKVFYFVRPSAEVNLAVLSTFKFDRNMVFGRDYQRGDVFRVTFRAGDSYLIPGTWPHAVFTPVPTTVIGSTHYHDANVAGQIRQWKQEQQVGDSGSLPYFPLLAYWSMKDIGESLEQNTDQRIRPFPAREDVLTLVDFVREHTPDIVELARGEVSAKDVEADCDLVSEGFKGNNT